jgi:hypothetical protein
LAWDIPEFAYLIPALIYQRAPWSPIFILS